MKIYLAGSVPKGNDEAKVFNNWRAHYQAALEKVFLGAEFIDPYIRGIDADESDSLLIVGLDCGHIRSSDLIVVNAEDKLGAGTSQELVVAKYFGLPVITVLPKDTYHRRSNITFHKRLLADWIHPFIDTFSDFVVESVEDVKTIKDQLAVARIKNIGVIDEAIAYAQGKTEKASSDNGITKDQNFTDIVKIMANTPPISNEELVRRNKKRQ